MTVAKEKADMTKKNQKRALPRQRIWRSSPPISTEPTYAGWTDQDWDPSWNWGESGWVLGTVHQTVYLVAILKQSLKDLVGVLGFHLVPFKLVEFQDLGPTPRTTDHQYQEVLSSIVAYA